jgi:glycosyltransferase involved in cell wall biosynthesis
MNSLVSVIIPTYKRSDYILRAINSVLNQTYKNIEIIIVDDNESEDEYSRITQKLLKELIDSKKIIYVKHNTNKGISAARNTGIKNSKGEYIAFLDDDDEFISNKTEIQLKIFNNSKNNLGLVYGAYVQIDDNNIDKELVIFPKIKNNVYPILGLNHIGPPSMVMFTKSAVERTGEFDVLLNHKEDIDFYYRLSEHYNVSFTNEIVMKYHVHSGAASKNDGDRLIKMQRFLEKHKQKMIQPKIRWSELQERLGELYAINKNKEKAFKTFFLAYVNRPFRFSILAKMILLLIGLSQPNKRK